MKNRRFASTARISFLALLFLGAALTIGALLLGAHYSFSAGEIEDAIRSLGPWSVAASIGLMILHSFVPFPAEILAVANGMVYGPVWGTVITWVGAMLGALLAFGLARLLGRPFVAMMVAKRDWQRIDRWTAERGGRLVFVGRLIPVISFNLINYGAGLTRISLWTYLLATGVGILPLTVLMAVMGDRIETIAWEVWLAFLAAALVVWFLVRRAFHVPAATADRRPPRPPPDRD